MVHCLILPRSGITCIMPLYGMIKKYHATKWYSTFESTQYILRWKIIKIIMSQSDVMIFNHHNKPRSDLLGLNVSIQWNHRYDATGIKLFIYCCSRLGLGPVPVFVLFCFHLRGRFPPSSPHAVSSFWIVFWEKWKN